MAKFKFIFYGALFLAILSAQAFAQEDYFPPPGIYIPCCSTGGTGSTGATYGRNGQSAWRQVWGAAPGDVVTIQFKLQAQSAGSLHSYPRTTGGSDLQYLGDNNNVYQKWYWNTFGRRDKGGEFCLDCLFQFTANYWNPYVYVEYWDSGDGWDVDLNVVNISTPPQTPPRQIYSGAEKENARWWRDTSGNTANFIGGFAAGYCVILQDRFCAGASLAYFIASVIQGHFGTIVQDPDDPWYQYPIDPDTRDYDPAAFGWGWTGDWATDSLMISAMVVGPWSWAADVTINRASTCIKYNDDCQWWQQQRLQSFHYTLGDWLRNTASFLGILRDQALSEGHYDAYDPFNDAVNVIWGAGDYHIYLANQGF